MKDVADSDVEASEAVWVDATRPQSLTVLSSSTKANDRNGVWAAAGITGCEDRSGSN
jgi:hypothetical protein